VAETVRKKSTLISAKIVEHALHGCYFYVLDDLITALHDGFDAVMENLQQVLRLGKSSGPGAEAVPQVGGQRETGP
jgi:hypothetical protein